MLENVPYSSPMCGIAGIVYRDGRKPDVSVLKRMTDTLVHRGPDGEGHVALEGCGLGHRRLSIIDLEGGRQPLSNEDESVWITFNGEVYNFLELRPDLESRGHRFRTHSDTEAIVHLYEELGARVPEKLRGMFAFAIWNTRDRSLLIARDRAGKKPVYWFEDAEGIYFASEIKALLTLPNCPREIDPESIDLYLTYQSIPGTKTIFNGVHRLPPASRLVWTGESAKIETYWQADWVRKTDLSYDDAKIRLRELIVDATKARLISDVPLGAFLSGGVDSSAVVSAMAEVSSAPVKTFSIGFPNRDFNETQYARMVAEKFGTQHEEFIVEPDAMEILPKLVWHYDQPYADSSALPTYYVSRMTRQRVTVALNGDGGDEYFGGYERYRALLMHGLYSSLTTSGIRSLTEKATSWLPEGVQNRSLARKIRRFARASQCTPDKFNLSIFAYFDAEARQQMYSDEFRARLGNHSADDYLLRLMTDGWDNPRKADLVDRVLRSDTLMYLPDTLLVKVDVASMAVSLETRSPLLDTSIMEFAASLPRTWKVGAFSSKKILKEAHHGILPYEILYRRKMGFSVPLSHWFQGELHGYIREILLDSGSLARGYFKREVIERLIDDHKAGRRNNAFRLWALLMLELWHRQFVDRSSNDK